MYLLLAYNILLLKLDVRDLGYYTYVNKFT